MADTATVSPDKQEVIGPAGKKYIFSKSISQQRIDKYFIKQGWTKSKDGKWLTTYGESTERKTPSDIPAVTPSKIGIGSSIGLVNQDKVKKDSAATDYIGAALPSAGAAVGGTLAGTFGAAIGGAAGEGLKIITRGILLNEDIGNKKAAMNIAEEAVKQAALQKVGDKAGDLFFSALSKIPHAVIKNGIKFLPSEIQPGGKISKYVEDLLGNLLPSAKTMEDFKVVQSKEILDRIESFAQGMSRFNGTSEEAGILVQKALKEGQGSADKALNAMRKAYIKKGYTAKQAEAYLSKTGAYKDFVRRYENELSQRIVATNKPELIAGLLRSTKAGLEDTRILNETLKELKPDTLGAVQNRLMRDMLQETITGTKDPVVKGTQALTKKFAGDKWKQTLDNIGEEKLKAIYGDQGYKNIEEFTKLVGTIGRNQQGSGIGKFMNLLFLAPFRSGVSGKSISKIGGTAFLFNRAAKIITSTEGIDITNKYVRASIANSPRLVNAAVEELRKFNERSDAEYEREEKEGEEQYRQEMNKNKGDK